MTPLCRRCGVAVWIDGYCRDCTGDMATQEERTPAPDAFKDNLWLQKIDRLTQAHFAKQAIQ